MRQYGNGPLAAVRATALVSRKTSQRRDVSLLASWIAEALSGYRDVPIYGDQRASTFLVQQRLDRLEERG